jgi:hypothetical protein
MLMIKFGKAGKTRLSDLPNGVSNFGSFQSQAEEGAKLEDLKLE